MLGTLAYTASYPCFTITGDMANAIAIEACVIRTVLGKVVRLITAMACFNLIVMFKANLEAAKAKKAWNAVIQLNTIMAQSIKAVSAILKSSSSFGDDSTVIGKPSFDRRIWELMRSVVNGNKGEGCACRVNNVALASGM